MKEVKLSKEMFINLMEFVKSWSKSVESKSLAIAEVLHSKEMLSSKSELACNIEEIISDPKIKDNLIAIIVDAMDDKESEWIYYYIYDLEWGEKNYYLKVYKEDNKTEIPLTTLEDLWNLLINKL